MKSIIEPLSAERVKMSLLTKHLAFLRRDYLVYSSYKISFFIRFCSSLLNVVTFFFISTLVGSGADGHLDSYGGQYFPFVLIGIAFQKYLSTAMGTFTQAINQDQAFGTLEAILISPTKISTMLIGGSVWNFLYSTLDIVICFLIAIFLFDFPTDKINWMSTFVMTLLTITSFSSFGILSASFLLVFKEGDPVSLVFNALSRLFGGVYFPLTILPGWIQMFSAILPITYSLHGLRMAMLSGHSIAQILPDILALSLFSLIFLPLSLACFRLGIRRAKKDGSLTYY